MGYPHKHINQAIKEHDSMIARQKPRLEEGARHTYVEYEGVLVTKQVAALMEEVKKAFRGVRFYASPDLSWEWGHVHVKDSAGESTRSIEVARQVYVTYPKDQYCMGTIGYGSFQKSTSNNVYMVGSRTIENEKYAAWNDEYHYVLTSDIKRAVKNAKTHLRPYTPKDFFVLSVGLAAEHAQQPLNAAHSKVYRTKNDIDDTNLHNELYHLFKSGHTFRVPKLQEQIAAWVEANDIQREELMRKVPACYVHIRPQIASAPPEDQLVDIFHIEDLRNVKWTQEKIIASLNATTTTASTLHPDFLGKVSVLSLLTDEEYVEGVGLRVSENVYWVETGEDTVMQEVKHEPAD